MTLRFRPALLLVAVALMTPCCLNAQEEGKVYNGSFQKLAADGRTPDGWQTAGEKAILQQVTVDKDPARGQVGRITCTKFVPGTSSSHVMLAQFGHVGVTSGRWYRVSLWARAADLAAGVVQVGLANFHTWGGPGLSGSFVPTEEWKQYEFTFQANRDLKPADSRFAILFGSTGTLWVADVAIEDTAAVKRQRFPVISMEGVQNAIPNSSFECGGAGWGCPADRSGGGSDVFERLGEWDQSQAFDGKGSWKLTLSADKPLMNYGGGFFPRASQVRSLQLGHEGWIRVEPGKPYVFSAYVKSDRAALPVRGTIVEGGDDAGRGGRSSGGGGGATRSFPVGPEWQRIEIAHTPKSELLWCAVGINPGQSDKPEGTLWIDAVQFERGAAASPYRPRAEVEAQVETGAIGNTSTDPAKGLRFRMTAYNAAEQPKTLKGRLTVTDFWGRTVWEEKLDMPVAAKGSLDRPYAVLPGRQGFFRIRWEPDGGLAQTVRCAVIEPYREDDSLFGFNHAFGREFVLRLSHLAGLRWWRDWSTHWDTVQPKQGGPFDFSMPDIDANYILGAQGRLLVLLPSSTAVWDADTNPEQMKTIKDRPFRSPSGDVQNRRAMIAFKPKHWEDFAQYVRETVKHYQGRVTDFEILNEPLYTDYALPSAYGYKTADYVEALKTAYQAAKSVDPKCTVIGGIACPPGQKWEEEFIEQDGLRWCDVHNYHWYPARQRAEGIETAFQMRWQEMQKRGQAKPIWVTEFGLYAEDDPPFTPFHVGDSTMDATVRPDELTCSADMVQLTAMMFANGVRKVLFHSGGGAGLHDSSASNIFFEYGGAPRKMYPALSVMARLLGPDLAFVRKWDKPEGVHAYQFRSRGRTVVVLWTRKANAPKLDVPQGFQALDFMGNPLDKNDVVPTEVPLYLVGA